MYWAIYLIVVFATMAMMVREGLWSNAVSLVSIIISGLVAFGFYSPLVIYLDQTSDGEHTYWLDFAVIWALYSAAAVICRALTGAASKTRMRFKNPIDPIGGPVAGLIAGWVLAAFALATMHVAPLPKDVFGGKLNHTDVAAASGITSPDAAWLRFIETMSEPAALGLGTKREFSANSFVKIYSDRRGKFDQSTTLIVDRR